MAKSGITYLDNCPLPGRTGEAWNPLIGCTHSGMPGCDHCWARELHTLRHSAWWDGKAMPAQYHEPFNEIQFIGERLSEPFSWRKPRLVMVCPQSDLFHEEAPGGVITGIFAVIHACPQHQFFVLTKRPQRASLIHPDAWPQNLGLLVSVSTQADADALVPWLLQTPAAWRGVSYEPALGPVDFEDINTPTHHTDALGGLTVRQGSSLEMYGGNCKRLNLVIAGCESRSNQPGRPAEMDWFRSVRDQCEEAGVAFYLKQAEIGGKVKEHPLLDGICWSQWAQIPAAG